MKYHSMKSSWLFSRGTTFSQTVTYNNKVFLPADTNSIVQTHTFYTKLVNKNTQNRTFYNSVGGWITGIKRNFWLHAICACTEQHSTYQIRWENWWLGLRIWCLGNFVVENELILSWSNFCSKINIQIQSWSEKIASILQDILILSMLTSGSHDFSVTDV